MRRAVLAAVAALALVSCKSSAPSTVAPVATQAPASSAPVSGTGVRVTDVFVRAGDSFRPERGPAALKAFVPEVSAQEKGGECQVTRTAGSGATIVIAYYPARVGVQSQLSVTFDSAGHLIRYSERRGVPPPITGARGFNSAQLDSAFRANEAQLRSTTVSLDYGIDQGIAMNRGAGKPTVAIMGTVREIEHLDQLGPPAARLERMRKLCGV
ncbi:MAG: hypothetical protein ACREBE_19005 [bacterium]